MTLALQIPDRIRILTVYGVGYWIEWEKMLVGCSFFIKTPAPASEVKKLLRPAERFLRIDLTATQRNEMGFYGVRVWRMA